MFTEKEIGYIRSQRLARIATVSKNLLPDVAPVGFEFDGQHFIIRGFDITRTFKYKNVKGSAHSSRSSSTTWLLCRRGWRAVSRFTARPR